jgi:hypothetical protein
LHSVTDNLAYQQVSWYADSITYFIYDFRHPATISFEATFQLWRLYFTNQKWGILFLWINGANDHILTPGDNVYTERNITFGQMAYASTL